MLDAARSTSEGSFRALSFKLFIRGHSGLPGQRTGPLLDRLLPAELLPGHAVQGFVQVLRHLALAADTETNPK